MDYRRLLDPKGFAKDEKKVKKQSPSYGPQQTRKAPNNATGFNSNPGIFDANALLNPRLTNGRPKPAASISEPKSSPIKFDPRALLAPKSAGGQSRAASSHTRDSSSSSAMDTPDESPQRGMGDFLSQLNNLNNRSVPLPSKRKSELVDDGDSGDEEHKKSKTAFAGSRSGREIGEYMKAEREKGAAENGSKNEPIDFTNEEDGHVAADDDDVVITGEKTINDKEQAAADNTEVCLGMLHSQALVWQIPTGPRFQKPGPIGKGWWPQTRVIHRRVQLRNNTIELFSKANSNGTTGIKFGNLDGKLSSVLCPLLDGQEVNKMRLKIYLDPFEKMPGEFPGSRVSRLLKLRIIIYAPRQKASVIGMKLSQRQCFLVDPIMIEPGVEYENPQDVKMKVPGLAKSQMRMKPQNSTMHYVSRTQEEILRETTDMFDSLVKSEDLPEKEANEDLVLTPLMSHQKQALHFMTERERDAADAPDDDANFSLWKTKQEKGRRVWYNVITNHQVDKKPEPARGGILADVMGLGKTLSILALIADTLVEAREFGASEPKVEDEKILRNSKATLIICPKSVMANWQEQIKSHIKAKALKVYPYHGPSRTRDANELAKYDVVLAPYQTAASDFSNNKNTGLAAVQWFRVVLDEAHMIRNPSTHVSKGCCKLVAQRRWAVTGTPVQNRLDDLGALIKFLRIRPFDEGTAWSQHIIGPFRSASEHVVNHLHLLVDSITLRRMKDKIGLKDKQINIVRLTFSDEEMAIYSRFAKESNRQLRVMLMQSGQLRGKSYAHVLKSLSRLRAICAHGREMLSEDDQKELDGLTAATAIDLGDEPDDNPDETFISEKLAYDTFTMMTESEVAVCVDCGNKVGEQKDNEDTEEDSSDSESEEESSVETENDTIGFLTPCFHLLCPKCKDSYIEDTRSKLTVDHYHSCAYCEQYVRWGLFELTRQGLKAMLETRSNKNKKGKQAKWDESTYSGPHTKVQALLQDLEESQRETALLPASEPPIRSVVFSGWTTYLDLIEYALEEHQIGFVRLDGSMSVKARSNVLQTFNSDPTITVLLVSIKAGGQGLNFTAANKVYMMEPQFNPGVEIQAIDRVHRLGQTRDVAIKHYIMKESVEEKILTLQEKKLKLAKLSMERKMSKTDEAKERLQELKDLFK